jgi:hypothetical protein
MEDSVWELAQATADWTTNVLTRIWILENCCDVSIDLVEKFYAEAWTLTFVVFLAPSVWS